MKKLLAFVVMLCMSITTFAAVGDETIITANQIVEISQESYTTKSGKERVEIIVIFKDNDNKKRLAYMTQADYKKYEKAIKYKLDVEYVIVEMKSKLKLTIK